MISRRTSNILAKAGARPATMGEAGEKPGGFGGDHPGGHFFWGEHVEKSGKQSDIYETIWETYIERKRNIYIYNTHRHLGWCFVTFWRFRWFFGARHWYFWILERALVKRDRNAIVKCTHVGDPVIKWWIISRHRTGIKLWFHFYFNTLF